MVYFFILVVVITFFLTLVVLALLPSIYYKINQIFFPVHIVKDIPTDFNSTILNKSLAMAGSDKVTMVWEESSANAKDLIFKFLKKNKPSEEFQKYNYPRAFLFVGIVSYLRKTKNDKELLLFKNIFEAYIKDTGEPAFVLNRVDQAPFGIVALYLYESFNDTKYLKMADYIFKYLEENIDPEEQIIDYRPHLPVVLNDMLGLVIPFLMEYSRVTKNIKAKELAEMQMKYYTQYGVDAETFIPSHGINKLTKTKIGSANWGRGIGWYLIGLSYCTQYNTHFKNNFEKVKSAVLKLKTKDHLYSQFPGSSETFDASTTLMTLYAFVLQNKNSLTEQELFNQLKKYLTPDGIILQTSGDTVGLNDYSKTFGNSELSQGLLLLIMSELV